MNFSPALLQHLERVTGFTLRNPRVSSLGGGDINAAYRLQAEGIDWFVKINSAKLADMFAAEAAGLLELADQGPVKVPALVCHGSAGNSAFLVLEYIALSGLSGDAGARFGEQLAALHRVPQEFFGWHIDNTIGSTPQHNQRCSDWVEFWRSQRLGRQLKYAARNGFGGGLQSSGEKLIELMPALFDNYRPHPSLLHGDLWGGNVSADNQGNPVMFDPACYYGDRETDIAMTELFGGFGREFYAAYNHGYPLNEGYQARKTLYNLYHILNHLNLFGAGYLGQANNMIAWLLAEIK